MILRKMKTINWETISNDAEKRNIPPTSLMFYKLNRRYPTTRELNKFVSKVMMPDGKNVNKKKMYSTKKRFEEFLKNEEKN